MIKRNLLTKLREHLLKKEISLIVGPRQAGKTTLMFILENELEQKREKTLFLSMDIEKDRQFFASQTTLIDKIKLEIGLGMGYVFLDEIQRKGNAGLFLKGIYDLNLPYKFVTSGSGSVELKEKIHESLVGRKRIFELNTVSFVEFVNYKTNYQYEDRLEEFFTLDKIQTESLFFQYLNTGGYPRIILSETMREKTETINEIYRSYLEKDIAFLGVKKIESFGDLIKIIASQIGNITNINELSVTLGISIATVKNYLWYGQKTFVLNKISPYFQNIRKEITKSPVYYFNDLGLRNFAIGIFGKAGIGGSLGFLFQNFVYLILKEKCRLGNTQIKFWRTKDGAEVDFVVDYVYQQLPIEVKYAKLKKGKVNRSLRSFIKKYQPEKALVVNLTLEKEEKIENTRVVFLPFYRLINMAL